MRIGRLVGIGVAGLVAGCVEPAYPPGPIQLQQYPPPVIYRTTPDYRPPLSGPVPLQPLPLEAEPLPPPSQLPDATTTVTPEMLTPLPDTTTSPPADDTGAIPLQDMPALAPEASSPAVGTGAAPAAPKPTIPTTGPGSNVPLEGFRPMRGQTRPTP